MPPGAVYGGEISIAGKFRSDSSLLQPFGYLQCMRIEFRTANHESRPAGADFLHRGFERRLPAVTDFRDMSY